METFVYDAEQSYATNYARWRLMNSDERQEEGLTYYSDEERFKYNQRTYSDEEARAVFDRQYKAVRHG